MTMCPGIGPLCLISTIQNHVMSRGRENQPRWGKKSTFRDTFKCEADRIIHHSDNFKLCDLNDTNNHLLMINILGVLTEIMWTMDYLDRQRKQRVETLGTYSKINAKCQKQ